MATEHRAISVVIPVNNSASILLTLPARLESVLRGTIPLFEVILVNDGSRDLSWGLICDLEARYSWARGFNPMRNNGRHNAVLCGIRLARYEVVITIDDDLQHRPEEIPKLLELLDQGFDVAYGTPEGERHGLWRDLASRVTKLALTTAMGADIARNVGAFRALRTKIGDAFADFRGPFVSVDTRLTWGPRGLQQFPGNFPTVSLGSLNILSGNSSLTPFNMMTGFSTIPLQFANWIGFVFTAVGVSLLAYVVGGYLIQGSDVPGFAFLASMIALFFGTQLFALGINRRISREDALLRNGQTDLCRSCPGWKNKLILKKLSFDQRAPKRLTITRQQ